MPFSAPPSSTASPVIIAEQAARRATLATTLANLYPVPTSLILEIGCGHGHLLSAYAAAHPETPCLGVDLVTQRIARALRKQTRLGLNNLVFLKADVSETLAALPPHVHLAGIFVLFPDPWPKQRHHHRRLLQADLLDVLAMKSTTTTWLAIRSDHPDYFNWVKMQINNSLRWKLSQNVPWPFEYPTYFQELKGPHESLIALRHKEALPL